MEIFNCYGVGNDKIILNTEKQLESLYDCFKSGKEILLRWDDEGDSSVKRSRIVITEELMSRVKDGRLLLESRNEGEEE